MAAIVPPTLNESERTKATRWCPSQGGELQFSAGSPQGWNVLLVRHCSDIDFQHHLRERELADTDERLRWHGSTCKGFTRAFRPIEAVTHIGDVDGHFHRIQSRASILNS